jgi:hypothetical protein
MNPQYKRKLRSTVPKHRQRHGARLWTSASPLHHNPIFANENGPARLAVLQVLQRFCRHVIDANLFSHVVQLKSNLGKPGM